MSGNPLEGGGGTTEAHLIRELDIDRVCGQINGGAVAAYVEDAIVICGIYFG